MSSPFPVTVHPFSSPTPFSCAYEHGPSSSNALIYIGGLTSGPHTTPHLSPLITALQAPSLAYSFWEFRMRSSYSGFGYSSLANDAADIAALVTYLRGLGKKKIVLFGASTGCQAILTALNPNVTAYILQSPTSDRETATLLMGPDFIAKSLAHAEGMIASGNESDCMPRALVPEIFTSPLSAYRWHSILAVGGDDDFFSSDLSDEVLEGSFGKLEKPTLVLMAGEDEMVPGWVDKEKLLGRWVDKARGRVSELSGINLGADHEMKSEEAMEWMVERVVGFLGELGED